MWLYLTYHSLSSSLGLSTCPIDDSDDRSLCALPEHGFISIDNHFSKVPSQLSEHKDEFRSNSLILFSNFKVEGNLESKSFSTEKKKYQLELDKPSLTSCDIHSLFFPPDRVCSACGNTHLLSGSLSLSSPLSSPPPSLYPSLFFILNSARLLSSQVYLNWQKFSIPL